MFYFVSLKSEEKLRYVLPKVLDFITQKNGNVQESNAFVVVILAHFRLKSWNSKTLIY